MRRTPIIPTNRGWSVKVDNDAVSGIILKVTRAYEHLSMLRREIDLWNERTPYRLIPEVQANGAKRFLRVHLAEPIPVMWSVILGEAVHDLRSALDHVV